MTVPAARWALSRAEVAGMHALRDEAGLSPMEIAERTGRSRPTVQRALRTDPADVPVERPRAVPPDPSHSARLRQARARLRRGVLDGAVPLADALSDPAAADVSVADVVRWQYRGPAHHMMERLGRAAVRDRVNLMARAGSTSAFTRAWVVEHGTRPLPTVPWRLATAGEVAA